MPLTESISFVQYKYCSLCRISCKKFKKHVHSQVHQKIVKNILTKFSKKILDAKKCLEEPIVKEENWSEAEKQLWCYFCQLDTSRHLRRNMLKGDCIVVDGGFLGHMTREDHVKNTAKFLKDNLIDMTRTPEFILTSETFLKFMEKVERTCNSFCAQRELALRRVAVSIKAQNIRQQHVVAQGLLEQSLSQQCHGPGFSPLPVEDKSANLRDGSELPGKKTVRAFGIGLTAVERINEDDSQGNIYSGALPPWLQAGSEEDAGIKATIGPTLEDFQKHKKLEQKKQLPAGRVGAKFDRTAGQYEDWLPNFGGVWSHGPRTKTGDITNMDINVMIGNTRDRDKWRKIVNSVAATIGPDDADEQHFLKRHNHHIKNRESAARNAVFHHKMPRKDFHNHSPPFSNWKEPSSTLEYQNNRNETTQSEVSGSHPIPLHHRPSSSRDSDAESLNSEIAHQGSEILLRQGIKPYVSKRKRKSATEAGPSLEGKLPNHPVGLNAAFSSNVSDECSSFTSNLKERNHHGVSSTSFPSTNDRERRSSMAKEGSHPYSSMSAIPFQKHFGYNPPFQFLSTPVLNAKKQKKV